MIDDATRTNPLALITTAKMAAVSDLVTPVKEFISVSGDAGLTVSENVVVTVGSGIFVTERTNLSVSDLDAGAAFVIGNDYYVYICDNNTDTEVFKISLNSTFPVGFTANNSRKIGGFHFGVCRRTNAILDPINTAGVIRGAGWQGNIYNGIIGRSVWTLKHRPKCSPEGMTYLGGGTWVDIYISSLNGLGGLQSAYNELPATGTEGLHVPLFAELLQVSDKRMMTLAEFYQCAKGAPAGEANNNTNAWAMSTNTARQRTGFVGPAVSSIGCRDTTGNVYEWLNSYGAYFTQTGANSIQTAGSWRDVVGGADYGQAWLIADNQLVSLLAGGLWNLGASAGPRCVLVSNRPWHVLTSSGVRGACDSL